jgi:hypothetical protein
MEPDNSITGDQLDLCQSCQQLDLIRTFQTEPEYIPSTGKSILQLGKAPRNIAQVKCPLCHFFFSVSTTYKRNYQLHVRLFDQIRPRYLPPSDYIPRIPFWSVLRDDSTLEYDSLIRDEIAQKGIIAYHAATSTGPRPVRALDATAVDY